MSEYTPTTKDVREVWIYAQDITHDEGEDFHGAEFDRWLAAHDAEVLRAAAVELEHSIHHLDPAHPSELSFINCTRIDAKLLRERADRTEARAGVVAEEPEWEYGYELIESDTRDVLSRGWPFGTAERAGEKATKRAAEEFDPEYPPLIPQVVRRSKCGPWLAVGEWVPVKQEGQS